MSIGDRIKILRKENNLTQTELGNILGLEKSTISMYENDRSTPNDEIKIAIAKYFGVTVDYLVGFSNIRNPYKDEELTVTDDDVIAAHGKTEKVELSEEDLQDIQDFLKQMRKKGN